MRKEKYIVQGILIDTKDRRVFFIFDPQMFHVKHYKQIFISDIIYL